MLMNVINSLHGHFFGLLLYPRGQPTLYVCTVSTCYRSRLLQILAMKRARKNCALALQRYTIIPLERRCDASMFPKQPKSSESQEKKNNCCKRRSSPEQCVHHDATPCPKVDSRRRRTPRLTSTRLGIKVLRSKSFQGLLAPMFLASVPCISPLHAHANFYFFAGTQFIASRGNEYFCEIDEEYLTDRFNLTGLNADVQYYQYALDLVTDVFDLDCDDDMREQIEKSARHLYGLVHARYITTTRGLGKMVRFASVPLVHDTLIPLSHSKTPLFPTPPFTSTALSTSVLTMFLCSPLAGKIQKIRLRQMPARPLPWAPPSSHWAVRSPHDRLCQALLLPLRGPLQPEIVSPCHHRWRLLRHQLHQHPLPGLPRPCAGENQGEVLAEGVWLQSACKRGVGAVAG